MAKITKINQIKGIKIVTSKGYLFYPNLDKPTRFDEKSDYCYKIKILLDTEDTKDIENNIAKLAKQANLKSDYHSCLQSGDSINEDRIQSDKQPYECFENKMILQAKSKLEIRIVDSKKNLILKTTPLLNLNTYKLHELVENGHCRKYNDSEYNGFEARFIGILKPYKNGNTYGVTCYLSAVQVINKGISLGVSLDGFDIEEEAKNNEDLDDDVLPF